MPIKITTKKDGFWRAGVQHFGTQIYPDGKFTKPQLTQLKAEPILIVEEITEECQMPKSKAQIKSK